MVVIIIILTTCSAGVALPLVAVLTAAIYNMTEPIIELLPDTLGGSEQGFAENNLLEPYSRRSSEARTMTTSNHRRSADQRRTRQIAGQGL